MSEEFSYGRTVKPYPPYNVSTDLEDTTPEHIAGIAAVAAVNDKVEEIQEDAASLIGPATKIKAGLVILGNGLSVTSNGTTSITESDSVFVDSDGEVVYKLRNRLYISTGYSNLTVWGNSQNFDLVSSNSLRGMLYVTIRRMYQDCI